MSRFCLRKAAVRVLSSSAPSKSTRSRSLTTFSSFQSRISLVRTFQSPLQRRWASGDETQAEPAADRETEAQHGDNSITASSGDNTAASQSAGSEHIQSSEHGDNATIAEAVKSAANTATTKVSDAAGQIATAASSAVGSASDASEAPSAEPTTTTLYVGNLFFDVKEQDLEKEFSKAGQVVKTKIIYDQRGLSKGYVLSRFTSPIMVLGRLIKITPDSATSISRPWKRPIGLSPCLTCRITKVVV